MERLPELAADLARLNVSVIVAIGTFSTGAARHAAPNTPIVFLLADAIGAGIVTNLRRPGGNITGVSELRAAEKWPELAKEVLPGLTRVGYLVNPTNASSVGALNDARRSAEVLGIAFRSYPVERPEDLEGAFVEMKRDGIGVLFLDTAHPYPTNWPQVAELALTHKLPAISGLREFPLAGGLMSYGVRLSDMTRLLAQYVDRILKGLRPAISRSTADQVRAGDQPQNREGARPRCTSTAPTARRRSDLNQAARVHHAARQRGCDMAACSTCAAARPDAVNRRAGGLCGE